MKPLKKIPMFFHEVRTRPVPAIDRAQYSLVIAGDVQAPLQLTLDELENDSAIVDVTRRFYCVNGWSLEARWRGVLLSEFARRAKPLEGARFVTATSIGGYEDTSYLPELINGGALLATHMNGEPLSAERGFPVRLLLFDRYQFRGVKALTRLQFVRRYRPGAWVQYGYTDSRVQGYPHLAIDTGEEMMPPPDVLEAAVDVFSDF